LTSPVRNYVLSNGASIRGALLNHHGKNLFLLKAIGVTEHFIQKQAGFDMDNLPIGPVRLSRGRTDSQISINKIKIISKCYGISHGLIN